MGIVVRSDGSLRAAEMIIALLADEEVKKQHQRKGRWRWQHRR